MMKYKDIPVEIAKKWLAATFEFVSTGHDSRACVINIADRVMVIDEAYQVKNGNIPQEWIKPIIDKLQELIANKQ